MDDPLTQLKAAKTRQERKMLFEKYREELGALGRKALRKAGTNKK